MCRLTDVAYIVSTSWVIGTLIASALARNGLRPKRVRHNLGLEED